MVRAAVLKKEGKILLCWETADINYYIEVIGFELVGWTDLNA